MDGWNPFLRRELREHGRRPAGVLLALGLAAGFTGGLVLLLALWAARAGAASPPPAGLWLCAFPHFLLTAAAGLYGGDRVFGAEFRRGTLDAVRLLPYSPAGSLCRRLVFPFLVLGLAAAAPLPVYLAAAGAGLLAGAAVWPLCLTPLAVGTYALGVGLLLPVDGLARLGRGLRNAGRLPRVEPDLLARSLVILLPLLVDWTWLGPNRWQRLPGITLVPVPGWVGPAAAVALFLLAAGVTARAAEGESCDHADWGARFRLAIAALLYGAVVVTRLRWLPDSFWLSVIAAPVLLLALSRRPAPRPRQADRRAPVEIEWAAALCDNALLVRDLRGYTRRASLRSSMLRAGVLVGGGAALGVWIAASVPETDLTWLINGLAYCALVAACLLALAAAILPYAAWSRDRAAGTLSLLFLTRLPSREILRGRLLAGLIYTAGAALPVWVAGIAGAAWFAARAPLASTVALLAPLPVLGLFIVALGCIVRPQHDPPWRWPREDWLEALLSVVQVLSLLGSLALYAWILAGATASAAVAAGGLLFLVNGAIVRACYLLRLRTLEKLRRGELPLPDA